MKLRVKVVPGASANSIAGWLGDELKLRVSAAPEKGKANQAVIDLLAAALDVPAPNIVLTSGSKSAHKTFEIVDFTMEALRTKLAGKGI